MHFRIDGIEGECEFDTIDMRDGLRISGYAARLQDGSVEASGEAMEKIGEIALKYLKVNGEKVNDIAGLVTVIDDEKQNPTILIAITLKFMELFNNFL